MAYDTYLKGRYQLNKSTAAGARKAIHLFEQATREDTTFALAYVGLADAHNYLARVGTQPPKEIAPLVREALMEALAHRSRLPEAHTSLAMLKLQYDGDWDAARREFERALDLNPNLANAHLWYGCYLSALGRHGEALASAHRAFELEPLSFSVAADLGWYSLFARRYDEAAQQCRRTLELEPHYGPASLCLQLAYIKSEHFDEALAEAKKLLKQFGAGRQQLSTLDDLESRQAVMQAWEWYLRGMEHKAKESYMDPYALAMVHATLGNREEALLELERSFEERSALRVYLNVDPTFDIVRDHPCFAALIENLNLPQ